MDMLRGGWGPGMLGNGAGTAGAGSSYAAETEAIAAAFTTPPTTGRKNLIDAAVVALKSAGVWTKLDALYAFAAADSQAAKINWKAPGTYNCTEVNAPTFTADRGFTGASTKYLDTGFNPTTAPSPKFTQNDAGIFAWSVTNVGVVGSMVGSGAASANATAILNGRYSVDSYYARVNQGVTNITAASTNSQGLWTSSRLSAANGDVYRNAVSQASGAAGTAVAPDNANMHFLHANTDYWVGQCAAGGFGLQLSAADNTALYNALRTYLTGVGVP